MALIMLRPDYWDKFIDKYGNDPIRGGVGVNEYNILERAYYNYCTLEKGDVVYTFDNQINFERDGVFWVGGFDTFTVISKPSYFMFPTAFNSQKEAIRQFVEGAMINVKYWNSVFKKYGTDQLYLCEIYKTVDMYVDHLKDKEIKFLKMCKPKQRKLIMEALERARNSHK